MIPVDKALHSAVGLAITFVVAYALLAFDFNWWKALLIGYFVTVAFAFLNELRDYLAYGLFDWRDITATLNPIVFVKYLIQLKL
ncbi:hypothetical protein [Ornithobacterium rhinotracheale]|uniref:Prenyltransferase n=2 Tax=Ornithobacterium rhinotracheale TaxID=28251 RepID=I4A324_ORNRL|nr:hypothetical protein [Ornithobacterium rhinotracheale]AFL97361.1 hypothetical protein Ornrh_1176 [Ornithobacterium rhinotracheale DSM 15997]AFL98358.1 hypothetical protein Ornrh_2227 [Ornithobacterium rhinotracheale DSM 15997]AIQ00123.1 hypothetical protein Q785_11265 [Ornithobacterium rhinotracheale ORT-UMN 88]KGB65809.1 hypothetical protein Q787_10790 [Ornithobacterium rhinotracheale H06-030791]MBN3662801.1 hypothetical protein [Ornithobacterium rhinotracheale]